MEFVYYQQLMAGMREAIGQARFAAFGEETEERWQRGDVAKLDT